LASERSLRVSRAADTRRLPLWWSGALAPSRFDSVTGAQGRACRRIAVWLQCSETNPWHRRMGESWRRMLGTQESAGVAGCAPIVFPGLVALCDGQGRRASSSGGCA